MTAGAAVFVVSLGVSLGIGLASMAEAGAINRACMAADRKSASPQLCGCIQKVANKSLTRFDRKLAARFFTDPQKAQEVRMSDRPKDEAFWDRYEAFGRNAAKACR